MANRTHPNCAIRNLASEARKRLSYGKYDPMAAILEPPKTATFNQRSIYLKLKELYDRGEEISDPVGQLADREYMNSLGHEEKQRYILTLCFDYQDMKRELLARLAACSKENRA